jgi:hypothetical protein
VETLNKLQLGRSRSPQEVTDIVASLNTLTGD